MHPHRSSALGYASAASAAHSRVYGACAAEAAASETSGLSVGGCPRAWRYFGPYPVVSYRGWVVQCSTTSAIAIVHFGSVGRLQGLFERSKAHPARG